VALNCRELEQLLVWSAVLGSAMRIERASMSTLKRPIGLQSSNFDVRGPGRALGLPAGAVSKCLRALRAYGIGAA
jgi:hypothetical protein